MKWVKQSYACQMNKNLYFVGVDLGRDTDASVWAAGMRQKAIEREMRVSLSSSKRGVLPVPVNGAILNVGKRYNRRPGTAVTLAVSLSSG